MARESGTPRILKMLDHYQVPATFFVTGVDALALHPEMLTSILKSGRESRSASMGGSTNFHLAPGMDGEEEHLLDRAIDYVTKATGKRPVGYHRAPSWASQFGHARPDPEEGLPLRQQSASARRALRDPVARQRHRHCRTGDRLDPDGDAVPGTKRAHGCHRPELLYQLYKDESPTAPMKRARCSCSLCILT